MQPTGPVQIHDPERGGGEAAVGPERAGVERGTRAAAVRDARGGGRHPRLRRGFAPHRRELRLDRHAERPRVHAAVQQVPRRHARYVLCYCY